MHCINFKLYKKQQKPELGQSEPKVLVHKWAKGVKRTFTKKFQEANKHTKEMVIKKKIYLCICIDI